MEANKQRRIIEEKTEEVQDIIERMPTSFGYYISGIVFTIFIALFFFGYFLKYPDVLTGEIIINANDSPIKLISGTNGKLRLIKKKSQEIVVKGDILGYIENSGNLEHIFKIDSILTAHDPLSDSISELINHLPKNVSLGDVSLKYSILLSSLREHYNFRYVKSFQKKLVNQQAILDQQKSSIESAKRRFLSAKSALVFLHSATRRDSILYTKKVLSLADLERSQNNLLIGEENYESVNSVLISSLQLAEQTRGQIELINIENSEVSFKIKEKVLAAYLDFKDEVSKWKQRYVFQSPYNGRVQFLQFWTEGQFVNSGEPVFTVVPKNQDVIGQLLLPIAGAGKVKKGQEVVVKLANFPYKEYGSLKGFVKDIALTTNSTKTDKGSVETYLVYVEFPKALQTNLGSKLEFKYESRGTAEIITHKRRLINRVLDNVKYTMNQ